MSITENSQRTLFTSTTVSGPNGSYSYQNGWYGTYGNIRSVSYWGERRRKPLFDLFGNGTGQVASNSEEQNPTGRRYSRSGDTTTVVEYAASVVANANAAIPDSLISATVVDARNKLIKRVKDQNVNLAVSLAEYRSTANTVGDFARSVAKVLVQPKFRLGAKVARRLARRTSDPWSRKIRNAKLSKRDKDAVNAYLAYTYGLVPIMSDIHGSLELLGKRATEGYETVQRVTASRSVTKNVVMSAYQDPIWYQKRTAVGHATCSVRIKARYRVNSNVKAFAESGITNPASAVYELIPYSFVFDWIIPVGDYLSSLDASIGVESFVRIEGILEQTSASSSSGHQVKYEYKARTQPQVGMPSFVLRYEPSSSLKSALNGIALLLQRRL